jgi:hypothetical protein
MDRDGRLVYGQTDKAIPSSCPPLLSSSIKMHGTEKKNSLSSLKYSNVPSYGQKTDRNLWRLNDDDSRHTWHLLPDEDAARDWPQTYAEKWFLDLPLVSSRTHHSLPCNG